MAWRYETPVSVVAWALILSRALAAPLLSVYLAMARPLPVTARDILAQVELASGLGEKVALFGASAVMTEHDRERLNGLLAAVEAQRSPRNAALPTAVVGNARAEVATSSGPFALNGHQRSSQNGSRSHS